MADHNAKLVWRSGMTFDVVSDGKQDLPLVLSSSQLSQEEGDNGLSPMGLILAGLAGCTAMDVMSILQKKRQNVRSLAIEVEGDQGDEHPKLYRHVTIVYRVSGDVSETALERAIELSIDKYCPVNGMLKAFAEIKTRYEIVPSD
jgi:putative redox protein